MAGRKRHVLVDVLGLLLLVVVTAANVQDPNGAKALLSSLATQFRRLRLIGATRPMQANWKLGPAIYESG